MENLIIELKNGNSIICYAGEKYLYGSGIALLNKDGEEELYYHHDEWRDNPEEVIGAFFKKAEMLEKKKI